MIPAPFSPRPWSERSRIPTVFDADGKPVSYVQNHPFLFAIEQVHDALVARLAEMTAGFELAATLAGVPPAEIAAQVAPARELLKHCEPEKVKASL